MRVRPGRVSGGRHEDGGDGGLCGGGGGDGGDHGGPVARGVAP